ncbi:MAG: MFS transporter [Gemmataceae bacterium]|nr:MFS transporter [Gemmataceae bacterium]
MRHLLLGFLCLGTVIAYVQRLALSAPTKNIERDLKFGPEDMGMVMAAWFWGYALFQLPSGWMADRFGARRSLIGFAIFWSALTALSGWAGDLTTLALLWCLMGCAQAGLLPSATKLIGASFPTTQQAFASGALGGCMSLGAALSHWLAPKLLEDFDWRQVLMLYALPGAAWAMAIAFFSTSVERRLCDHGQPGRARIHWIRLLTDRPMQLLCAQQFLRAAAMAFFFTWFPRYLTQTRGITALHAGELAFWTLIAGMFGGFVGGLLSDSLLRSTQNTWIARQGFACFCMAVCGATALAAFFVTQTGPIITLLCLGAFWGTAGGVSGYSISMAYGGKQVASVFAAMNMSGNIGAGLFPLIVGWIVAITGNWNLALLVFAVLFALSGICWAFLSPQGTLFPENEEIGS